MRVLLVYYVLFRSNNFAVLKINRDAVVSNSRFHLIWTQLVVGTVAVQQLVGVFCLRNIVRGIHNCYWNSNSVLRCVFTREPVTISDGPHC